MPRLIPADTDERITLGDLVEQLERLGVRLGVSGREDALVELALRIESVRSAPSAAGEPKRRPDQKRTLTSRPDVGDALDSHQERLLAYVGCCLGV